MVLSLCRLHRGRGRVLPPAAAGTAASARTAGRPLRGAGALCRRLLLLIRLLLRLDQELLGQHQQHHRDGKNNHYALVYAGLVLRILELAQGSMPICAAAAASLYFTVLTLRVRPPPVRAPCSI